MVYNIIKKNLKYLKFTNTLKNMENPLSTKDFMASKDWFEKFKKRFGIHSIKIQGESASVDHEAVGT